MKKVIFFITLGICILVINNLVRSIYDLWHKNDLVVDAQIELTKQKQENQRLKSQLSYAESKEFIEEAARNKLLLVQPGEQGVLIPQDLLKVTSTPSANIQKVDPNWKRWWQLFF